MVGVVVSGALFVTGQTVLTARPLAGLVLASASTVLSVVGGLLTVVQGSVVPALIVHASFAAYYTSAPLNPSVSAQPRRAAL